MGVLSSLWEALEVEQEDVDRGIFVRLMSGPARLHGKSIQKVYKAANTVNPSNPVTLLLALLTCRGHKKPYATIPMNALQPGFVEAGLTGWLGSLNCLHPSPPGFTMVA